MKLKLKTIAEKDVRWLEVDAGVSYWEDGEINGKTDDENTPNMPFTEQNEDGEWRWRIKIDVNNGRIEGWPAGNTANVHYKVCDEGNYRLTDVNGDTVMECENEYVPECIGEYGDYIVMDIDANGYIEDFSFDQRDLDNLAEEWHYLEED